MAVPKDWVLPRPGLARRREKKDGREKKRGGSKEKN